ncbi:DMT family transporter [Pseudaestuariivita atlantica]|uniref:Multidrug DMT transporter permease n=1 Tax=Pseudaestuariivita atlantica TaxID=1317121 RepID=A0A0L1JUV3_9RHOB|nr:DMT family transporter [Pseudaestuariivita atlantica]KNG95554.1 multidrug DMT transporter permease [Pseudaestuariivita atlantica]
MTTPRTPVLTAGLWMLGAIVSFSLMAIAGRTLASTLDTFEIMFYRSLMGIVLVTAIATATGTLGQINRQRMGLHGLRNVAHFAGQNLWFFAITAAPLAQVFALEFTTPLWVLILSPLFLGERLTGLKVIAALLGFAGVLLVVRPGADFTLGIGSVAAALAAIGFAGSMIATKLLTRTTGIVCILFWLTVMQAAFGAITAGFDGDIALPDAAGWPWVVLVAVCGLTAHFSLTRALTIAPASVVVPFDFARLPVIALIGYFLYHEPLDTWVIAGAVVIFAGNYINVWGATRPAVAGR